MRGKTREISPPGRSLETRQFPRRAYKSRIKGALRSAFSKAWVLKRSVKRILSSKVRSRDYYCTEEAYLPEFDVSFKPAPKSDSSSFIDNHACAFSSHPGTALT